MNMKVVQINSCFGSGSTGKIAEGIMNVLDEKNIENYAFYGAGTSENKKAFKMNGNLYLKFNILKTRLFGKHGFYSHFATFRMIKKLKKINPDVIHLHNIHGHYINVKMLFKYIKKNNIKTIWTLHDCWAFTGHCAYFDTLNCEKWKNGCGECIGKSTYPISWIFDRSKTLYREKKKAFCGVENLTLVTPSHWLADLVKQSFLKEYPVKVINNGIDLDAFKPSEADLRKKYNIENNFVVMGIAFSLNDRKGGKYIIETAKKIKNIKFVIVGLETKEKLPENVIVLPKTNSKEELAKIYSTADVFVNPTLEDNFPTVNLEALSCGTPVITFKTGGSPESVSEDVGIVVGQGDVDGLCNAISEIRQNTKEYYSEKCVEKAKKMYNEKEKFLEYGKINMFLQKGEF